jgi:hypothetical protein
MRGGLMHRGPMHRGPMQRWRGHAAGTHALRGSPAAVTHGGRPLLLSFRRHWLGQRCCGHRAGAAVVLADALPHRARRLLGHGAHMVPCTCMLPEWSYRRVHTCHDAQSCNARTCAVGKGRAMGEHCTAKVLGKRAAQRQNDSDAAPCHGADRPSVILNHPPFCYTQSSRLRLLVLQITHMKLWLPACLRFEPIVAQ